MAEFGCAARSLGWVAVQAYKERSSITGQGGDDPAGLQHDQERNRTDNISLTLYLQGQGSGKTWDN